MERYQGQLTGWRPDYPSLWLLIDGGKIYPDNEEDLTPSERIASINSWSIANNAIKKSMQS